jgi:hypothetical protein
MYCHAYVIIHHDLALHNVTRKIYATVIVLYKVFNVNMTQLGASVNYLNFLSRCRKFIIVLGTYSGLENRD